MHFSGLVFVYRAILLVTNALRLWETVLKKKNGLICMFYHADAENTLN